MPDVGDHDRSRSMHRRMFCAIRDAARYIIGAR